MALGKTHRKFNITLGLMCVVIVAIFNDFDWEVIGCFSIAFGLGTFILTPDIDLGPNRFAGVSKLFIYPYSLMFKHRGISHSLFIGTITRVIYALVVGIILILLIQALAGKELNLSAISQFLDELIFQYSYEYWPHKWVLWVYTGLFFSDLFHIILDSLSSGWKKLF